MSGLPQIGTMTSALEAGRLVPNAQNESQTVSTGDVSNIKPGSQEMQVTLLGTPQHPIPAVPPLMVRKVAVDNSMEHAVQIRNTSQEESLRGAQIDFMNSLLEELTITGEQWAGYCAAFNGLPECSISDLFPFEEERFTVPGLLVRSLFCTEDGFPTVHHIENIKNICFVSLADCVKTAEHCRPFVLSLGRPEIPEPDQRRFALSFARKLFFGDIDSKGITGSQVFNVAAMVLAECTSPHALKVFFEHCIDTPTEVLSQLSDIFSSSAPYGGLREGGYNLALAIREIAEESKINSLAEIITGLLSGYYDIAALSVCDPLPNDFSEAIEILKAEKDKKLITLKSVLPEELQGPNYESAREKFAHIFGLSILDKLGSLSEENKLLVQEHIKALSSIGLIEDNNSYFLGLSNISVTLPTANKDLSKLTFLPSAIMDLQSMLTHCGISKERLKIVPFLVFDQTKDLGDLGTNKRYIDELRKNTGATIFHINMSQINEFGELFELRELFDTTGDNYAGYGGGRNIASLLGAFLHSFIRISPINISTSEEILSFVKDNLLMAKKVFKSVLTGGTRPKLIMGDDDTTLLPGFFASKALQAHMYETSSMRSQSQVFGRVSTNVPWAFDSRGYATAGCFIEPEDALIGACGMIHGAAPWSLPSNAQGHPIAGALLSPMFCLDLPLPSEEGHFKSFKTEIDDSLARTAHHCGDRIGKWDERLYSLSHYREQLALAAWLGFADGGSPLLPWNGETVANLSQVFTEASTPTARKERAQAFLSLVREDPQRTIPSDEFPVEDIRKTMQQGLLKFIDRERTTNFSVMGLFLFNANSVALHTLQKTGEDYRICMQFRKNLISILDKKLEGGEETKANDIIAREAWAEFKDVIQEAINSIPEEEFKESKLAQTFAVMARSCLYRFGELAGRLAAIGGENPPVSD